MERKMKRWECQACGTIYSEEKDFTKKDAILCCRNSIQKTKYLCFNCLFGYSTEFDAESCCIDTKIKELQN